MKIDWGMMLIWLLVIVPVVAVFGIFFWLDRKDKQRGTHFLGIQMDICILVVGLLLLLALIGWARKVIFS